MDSGQRERERGGERENSRVAAVVSASPVIARSGQWLLGTLRVTRAQLILADSSWLVHLAVSGTIAADVLHMREL